MSVFVESIVDHVVLIVVCVSFIKFVDGLLRQSYFLITQDSFFFSNKCRNFLYLLLLLLFSYFSYWFEYQVFVKGILTIYFFNNVKFMKVQATAKVFIFVVIDVTCLFQPPVLCATTTVFFYFRITISLKRRKNLVQYGGKSLNTQLNSPSIQK